MTLRRKQTGLSLVELMIAVALGIVLIAGVIEVYVGSKQTYRNQEALSRLQENARYALDVLSRDIRMVGFIGCRKISDVIPNEVAVSFGYSATGAIWGNQSLGTSVSGTLPDNIDATDVVDDTDVLMVQSAGGCSAPISADMGSAADDISVAESCGFSDNDVVLISDCSTADIFRITSASGSGTLSLTHQPTSVAYSADNAELMTFSSNSYYIGTDASGISALFMVDQTAVAPTPVALVEGVENMQVLYGVDSDGNGTPESYVNADAVTDWSEVVSLRITLLMRTIEEMSAQAMTFNVGGSNVSYGGGPIRRQFVKTVKLRNR